MNVRLRRPSPALVIACVALFVAVGGPAEAARLINGKKIKRGTVASKQVKDRSLKTRDLRPGAVRALTRTPAGSVGAAQLATGAVGAAQLAPDAVGTAAVADGSLTVFDLGTESVTTDELAPNAARAPDIASGAVGPSEIRGSAVRGAEVADGTLGGADLAEFRGSFAFDVPALALNACASTVQEVVPVRVTDPPASVADDLVLVAPDAGRWPAELTLTAVPQSDTSILVSACNAGSADPVDPPADLTFRYLAIGS